MSIEPDTKDWTWVLERTCPECGFDAPGLDLARVPGAIEDNATLWEVVLDTDDAAVRAEAHVWSPLEYACHVRDVNRLFAERIRLITEADDPEFENWDQDATAVEADYGSQDPSTVAQEVVESADAVADLYRGVHGEQWSRTGRRSNGSEFTLDSLARYHLHDLVHHAHDVSHVTKRLTVSAYDEFAADYVAAAPPMPEDLRAGIDALAQRLGQGARVLEIGSGSGRDALALEEAGLSVRRTDISRGFVKLLREAGQDADRLDPLTDDLTDGSGEPYDGVWASASLLHVRREDLPAVLERLAGVTRQGGVLQLGVKEGDGARFSRHGSVGAARHFTFWRADGLRTALSDAGWDVDAIETTDGLRGETWLNATASRR